MRIVLFGSGGCLGSAIVRAAAKRNIELVKVSRGSRADLVDIYCDLAQTESVKSALQAIENSTTGAVVIINSGILGEIGLAAETNDSGFQLALQINAISNISIFKDLYERNYKNFIIISSGASEKNYTGWFSYCQSKHLQRSIWEGIAHDYSDVKVTLVAPGVLNSEMHDLTSSYNLEKFPDLEKFVEIKTNHYYQDENESAEKLIKIACGEIAIPDKYIDLRMLS